MRTGQILVYERDRRIADLLRRERRLQAWPIREPRRLDTCMQMLHKGGPSALVVRLDRELTRELGLLERVTWFYPEAAVVVVGDFADVPLTDLIWDLGASIVFSAMPSGHELGETIAGFLSDGPENPKPLSMPN